MFAGCAAHQCDNRLVKLSFQSPGREILAYFWTHFYYVLLRRRQSKSIKDECGEFSLQRVVAGALSRRQTLTLKSRARGLADNSSS